MKKADEDKLKAAIATLVSNPSEEKDQFIMSRLVLRSRGGAPVTPPPDPGQGETLGLGYTPAYVPVWTRPSTLAAGISAGTIPSDAIDFSTGNAGGAFATIDAWIDACNSADKAGAIGTNNGAFTISPGTLTKKYLSRGLYGYGTANAKITAPTRQAWLFAYRYDVVIRGIEFVNFFNIIAYTRPTQPQWRPDNSSAPFTIVPFSTSTALPYTALRSNPAYSAGGGIASAISQGACYDVMGQRVGKITITSNGTITGLTTERQKTGDQNSVNNSVYGYSGNTYFLSDSTWAAALDSASPNLISGTVSAGANIAATTASLITAINAYTGTSGFSAIAGNATGEILLLMTGHSIPVLKVTKSGTATVTIDTFSPGVDLSYCTLTDCDMAIGFISDVVGLGATVACKNVGRGSWCLIVAPMTLRYGTIYVANNDWSECTTSRALAANRASFWGSGNVNGGCMPAGSTNGNVNAIVNVGANLGTYHWRYMSETTVRIENNKVNGLWSLNVTDGANCAVFAALRNNKSATDSISRNELTDFKAVNGAEDFNAIYLKCFGITVNDNLIQDFSGTAGGRDPETWGILIKQAGPFATEANCLPITIKGNVGRRGTTEFPFIKVDEQIVAPLEIAYNLLETWSCSGASTHGAIRVSGNCKDVKIHSNRFKNCNTNGADFIYFANNSAVNPTAANWRLDNNEAQNDGTAPYPAYTATTNLGQLESASGVPALTAMILGANNLKNAAGTNVGLMKFTRDSGATNVTDNGNAPADSYSSYTRIAV